MYIGNDLQVAFPSYRIIDDISSGFNGGTTSFALVTNGTSPIPFPVNSQQVLISVNGVIQEPDPTGSAGFKLSGTNIVFSSAPANGHSFFGVILAGADYITAGTEFPDGSVAAPSFTYQADTDTGWYRLGSGAAAFSSNGVKVLDFDNSGLNLPDSKKIQLGTANDLQIYHDGSNSYIDDAGTGSLIIGGTSETLAKFTDDGSSELYYDNSKKFETTSAGVTVTGGIIAGGLTYPTSDGSANQVLKTDGSGNLSFVAQGGGGGTTYSSDKNLYTSTAGNSNGGESNISLGHNAGAALASGDDANVFISVNAGSRCTGMQNVILGNYSGRSLTETDSCVVIGDSALSNDGQAYLVDKGIFIGFECGKNYLPANSSVSPSVAIGSQCALSATGGQLTLVGHLAGSNLTSGHSGVGIGYNVSVGTTGNQNVVIGADNTTLTTGSNNICIGNAASASAAGVSNEITLGNSSITKLRIPGLNTFEINDSGQFSGVASTASGTAGVRKITASTSAPSGGADGDLWVRYTA